MNKFSWFGNLAITLDNKLGEDNQQTNISNFQDFKTVHCFRNKIAAIGVGSSTIIIDNPSLQTKEKYIEEAIESHPIPVIFDRRGRVNYSSHVFTSLPQRPVIWINNSQNIKNIPPNAIILRFQSLNQIKEDIENELMKLDRYGGIMIEGGRHLLEELIINGIIKRLRIFTSNFELSDSTIQLKFPKEKKFCLLSLKHISEGYERVYSIN